MRKIIATLSVLGMLVPFASTFASVVITPIDLTMNSVANVTVDPGEMIHFRLHTQISGGSHVQSIKVAWPGALVGPGDCVDIDDVIVNGSANIEFDKQGPLNTTGGHFGPTLTLYGLPGTAADNHCDATPISGGTQAFPNTVTVRQATSVPVGTPVPTATPTPTPVGGSSSDIAALQAQINSLMALIQQLMHTTPVGTPVPMPTTGGLMLSSTLSYGMMNSADVRALQNWLVSNGFHIPWVEEHGATGNFLQQTAAAVRNYQGTKGLTVTGVVDAATKASLAGSQG